MATGNPVVSHADVVDRIRKINRKTIGIEVEAYGGLLTATSWQSSPPPALCLKSVPDFANKDKDGSARE